MSKKISLEELHDEIFEKDNAIEETVIRLKKAKLILGELSNEYSFRESPNLVAAAKYGSSLPGEPGHDDKLGQQSYKWVCEYDRIFNFIEIVLDYVHESFKELDDLMEKKILEGKKKTA